MGEYSMPYPPYSSGTVDTVAPSSQTLSMISRGSFLASSISWAGFPETILLTNFATVSFILLCSSDMPNPKSLSSIIISLNAVMGLERYKIILKKLTDWFS